MEARTNVVPLPPSNPFHAYAVALVSQRMLGASAEWASDLPTEDLREASEIRIRSLEEWICELLIKNQRLRTELMELKARVSGYEGLLPQRERPKRGECLR